jgi:peptide/nickel transport system substrate-binding protein
MGMMKRREFLKTGIAGAAAGVVGTLEPIIPANAQARKDTLIAVAEGGPNSLDSETVGANRPAYEVTWNTYDRLLTFGVKKDENGNDYYDYKSLKPELAEDYTVGDMSATFKLRKDAKFHDGTPVTAKDVKWSFERAIGVGGYPKFIFGAVSMTSPEQFVVVDDHTIRVDFLKRDNYTIPYIASPVGLIYNSELVKKNATAQDPWGLQWTKMNTAGSGAYKVEKWQPGQEIIYARNDDWNRGERPGISRIISRVVPGAGTRRALLERGDVDFSFDMPPKDVVDLTANKDISTISSVMDNTAQYISLNTKMAPFDNVKVREAIAYAVPYDDIARLAYFNRARPLGGGSQKVTSSEWPQKHRYATDIAKAKQLLAEAGYPNGFETTLSFDMSTAVTSEPLCVLLQNSLAEIGVRVRLNKIPGASWRTEFGSKKLPFFVNVFGGWLAYPYFYFGWLYYSPDAMYNTMNYSNPEMTKLIDQSHYNPDSKAADEAARQYIQMAFDDVPSIPVVQPYLNVAMRKNVNGFCYWFFRQVDYRRFTKA